MEFNYVYKIPSQQRLVFGQLGTHQNGNHTGQVHFLVSVLGIQGSSEKKILKHRKYVQKVLGGQKTWHKATTQIHNSCDFPPGFFWSCQWHILPLLVIPFTHYPLGFHPILKTLQVTCRLLLIYSICLPHTPFHSSSGSGDWGGISFPDGLFYTNFYTFLLVFTMLSFCYFLVLIPFSSTYQCIFKNAISL